MSGLRSATTATLQVVRSNLLAGLDRVAAAIADGTFHTVGPKGAAPPSQSGQITLALLHAVNAELAARTTHLATEHEGNGT